MASSPIPVLAIIALTLMFEALLFGDELAEQALPEFEQPDGILDALIGIVESVWGMVVFLANLLTFNIPGAPFWVRIPLATITGGALVWAIATLIRGNA